MAKKPEVDRYNAQDVRSGQEVWSKDFRQAVAIKSISVVLHLDNGHDEVYGEDEDVQVVKEGS